MRRVFSSPKIECLRRGRQRRRLSKLCECENLSVVGGVIWIDCWNDKTFLKQACVDKCEEYGGRALH